ncbi:MAG: FGGY-family carbohydrate kinase [Pseudomonadota bacterium]
MSLTLGIDIGTSGVRTAVLDENCCVIAMARAEHLPQNPDRIDAYLWWEAVKACIHKQNIELKKAGCSAADISRIAVDGTSGTMVLVDEKLRPVTRGLMYNSKGFAQEADQIAALAPINHITQGSASALGRAMRLVKEDQHSKARHLLHQADYIAAMLMERGGLSDHNNALKTGFDPQNEKWPKWIDQLIETDLLPDPIVVGAPMDLVSPSVSSELGLSKNATVYAGTTDSIAAFFACAPKLEGAAVTSLGSTLAIKVLGMERIDDPSIGLYSHRVGDHWLSGGASNTGGAVLASLFSTEELISLSTQIDPQRQSPLDYYPLLSPGERFPINDPDYPPRLEPRPAYDVEFLHGVLESMARIEEQCYRVVEAGGGTFPSRIYTAGGGAKNSSWTAIRARVLGVTPVSSENTEAAIGVAQLAIK